MKITLVKSLMIVGAFLCFSLSQAQELSGTVSDSNGPLPGASVVVKGTTNGTQTDFDGNYTLSDIGDNAVIIFSYIGFKKQEVAVNGQTEINVTLEEDAQALEEVVVTGYGTQAKKEITSAVTSVNEEDFNQGVVDNPAQLLQGKVAGLSIANPGGNPNQSATIRLRGISTVGGNQEPLVVIDGVLGGSLDSVDPADIQNITELVSDLLYNLPNRHSRPVYFCIRSYQSWLENALEDLQADPGPMQVVMVKHLAVAKKVRNSFAIPTLESGTQEITTPFVNSERQNTI